jgi:hypothetical protein
MKIVVKYVKKAKILYVIGLIWVIAISFAKIGFFITGKDLKIKNFTQIV